MSEWSGTLGGMDDLAALFTTPQVATVDVETAQGWQRYDLDENGVTVRTD